MPKANTTTPRNVLIPLATIAKSVKVEPKQARSKLRRAIANGDVSASVAKIAANTRWEFNTKQAREVKELIS